MGFETIYKLDRPRKNMMRSLLFSSPIGLGHASRDAAVAEFFRGAVKLVTGDAAAEFLKKSGFDVIDRYAPPQFTVEDGSLEKPLRWLWQYYRYYRGCKKISAEVIADQIPDIVISDEDFASLAIAQEQKIPSVLITDILETRFTRGLGSLVERRMNRSMRRIISRCDAVIVPEEGTDEGNIHRTGPIVRRTGLSRSQLRERLGFGRKTIVIAAGGTGAGLFLIERSLDAIRGMGKDYDVVVVSGPSLKREFGGARNLGFVENLHEIIYASDLVISLAGKSTIDEANAYGTPGIFIPIRNHFEQEDNAREQGFAFGDMFRLDSIIEEKIGTPRREAVPDGAKKAWDIIRKTAERH